MSKKQEAKVLFEENGMKLIDIADKLGINVNTVRTWRRREGWVKPDQTLSEYEAAKDIFLKVYSLFTSILDDIEVESLSDIKELAITAAIISYLAERPGIIKERDNKVKDFKH